MALTSSKATGKLTATDKGLQFINGVLNGLGAPTTADNEAFLDAQAQAENTTAANNPLATTQPYNGATNFNYKGVKNYPSLAAGIKATVDTLNPPPGSVDYYPGIRNDLISGQYTALQIAQRNSKELDTWGTGSSAVIAQLNQGGSSGSSTPWYEGGSLGGKVAGFLANPLDLSGGALNSPGTPTSVSSFLGTGNTKYLKDIVYGLSILGGGLTIIVGFILVAVDLGIASRSAVNPIAARNNRRDSQAQTQADTERATNAARDQAHKAALQRARLRQARAKARNEEGYRPRARKPRTVQLAADRKPEPATVTSGNDDIPY